MISEPVLSRTVLTDSGVKNIEDVNIGDHVFEWKTGRLLEIKDIDMLPYKNMYSVHYSDGRIEYHTDSEVLYLDDVTPPKHYPSCECMTTADYPVILYPMNFKLDKVVRQLYPDPYAAGALLIFGDQDDEYMNWPIDRNEANNEFAHKYHMDYHEDSNNGKAYFKYDGVASDKGIKWTDFFSGYLFHALDRSCDNMVPIEYLLSSINDRWQFIRGVFDIGYIKYMSPDSVAAFHWSKSKLKVVQNILWSLGIPSLISENTYENTSRKWKLEIIGSYNKYPGFFYHRPYIESMINASGRFLTVGFRELNSITVVKVEPLEWCPFYTHNSVPHILLEKPHGVYTSPNYLPRVSI